MEKRDMNNNRIVLILFTVMILLTGSVASVSAQQIDVENMDNAQLITLLQSIMKKLEQGEEPAAETDPAEAPAAAATTPMPMTEKGAELPEFMIYENKKMNVEALPAYMFIQPTQPPKPERDHGKNGDKFTSGGTDTSSED